MKISKYKIKYEVLGILTNFISIFFSFFFPIIICSLVGFSIKQSDAPEMITKDILTRIYLGSMMMIPLSICLITYPIFYANELEHRIIHRLELFGVKTYTILLHRGLVYLSYLIICTMAYTIILNQILEIHVTSLGRYIVFFAYYLFFAFCLLILGHGLALLVGKMSIIYGIVMPLYFFIMMTGGIMGITVETMPNCIKLFSYGNFVTYASTNIKGGLLEYFLGYGNQLYMISYVSLIWFLVAVLVLFVGIEYRKRNPLY